MEELYMMLEEHLTLCVAVWIQSRESGRISAKMKLRFGGRVGIN